MYIYVNANSVNFFLKAPRIALESDKILLRALYSRYSSAISITKRTRFNATRSRGERENGGGSSSPSFRSFGRKVCNASKFDLPGTPPNDGSFAP